MDIKVRMPGLITAVNVKEGDLVKPRDVLCVMEAMKMEQPILSPAAGTVKAIKISVGEKVKTGQVVATVE
jgi:biotin carboxyl carrier protein